MISLVIISAMAMAVAPSLSEVLNDNRQHSASLEVVRFAREVRAQTRLTGVAHMMRFRSTNDPVGSFALGRIELMVSMNNKCLDNQTQFVTVAQVLDMRDFNPANFSLGGGTPPARADANRHAIFLEARLMNPTADGDDPAVAATVPVTDVRICFQPNGQSFSGVGGIALGPQVQHLVFTVGRTVNGAPRGRVRQILLPIGGSARLR